VIAPDFPDIFQEFNGKQISLLFRGSDEHFDWETFRRRCDGRTNTLTVALDTEGNIFGGFTPLELGGERTESCHREDLSLKSFLFTLKNPDNSPARKFPLKPEKKDCALYCSPVPSFGGEDHSGDCCCDLIIDCKTAEMNLFGNSYDCSPEPADRVHLFGNGEARWAKCDLTEVEVFEITP
jgi:hypothetical protein